MSSNLNNLSNDANNIDSLIKNSNTIYKGWILTYQDVSTDLAGDISTNSLNDNLKWVPKFAVINKQEKCFLLYDYEPSLDILTQNFLSINTANNSSHFLPNEITYRLDNSVNQELFINYWKNRLSKFDLNLIEQRSCLKNNYNYINDDGYLLNFNNHHLSNKDIELIEKEALNKTSLDSAHNSTSAQPAFRFAGLFFKKDKAEKVKHSSLKRAKSGIQLERKKPIVNTNNTTLSQDPKSTQNSTDYENRHRNKFFNFKRLSLPSPMRPSRSHESLSSPLKPSITLNNNLEQNELKMSKTSHFNRINQFLASNRSNKQQLSQQTPSLKTKLSSQTKSLNEQIVDCFLKLDLSSKLNSPSKNINNINNNNNNSNNSNNNTKYQVFINSIHSSLFNEENCFEVKCLNSTITVLNPINKLRILEKSDSSEREEDIGQVNRSRRDRDTNKCDEFNKLKYNTSTMSYNSRYFMCRTSEERDKWMQCLRDVAQPNLLNQRHDENSLQVWILEAKGQTICSKPNKKYFCEIYLNNTLYARSCSKEKKDILFWGENFDFSNIHCDYLRIELYQHTIETQKKKSKKEKDKDSYSSRDKESSIGKDSANSHPSNQTLLGYIQIPVNSIESSQPVEKWYKLENGSDIISIQTDYSNGSNSNNSTLTISSIIPSNNTTISGSNNNSASFTTTQNFSKDSISIRIKAKYLSVDILPLNCYQKLIEFIRVKYLNLITLEPYLNVRIKDDLANSLVRIAHKLQIQTKFLTDLVLAEVLQLEDNSLTFRGNSLATKAMESYMKLVGENYLKLTLSDCVKSIIETNHDLEIDPSKVSNQSSLQHNREELVQILHLVCGRVFNSCVNFPIEMKQVFSCLRTECKKNGKTDEMCDTLISASIFLRFICPAILSPNLFNLTQEYPQEKAARKLTLAAKTLQTIANFSKFGGKEFYMSFDKMNQFVDEHTVLMREFLRNISTLTEDELFELNNNKNMSNSKPVLPVLTLTPQTPKLSRTLNIKQSILLSQSEANFDLELIDLGKQLSILHSLLTSISAGLDEQSKFKFDAELSDILAEISNMKKNCNFTNDGLSLNLNSSSTSKLYSYENRLHYALMKSQQIQNSNSPVTPTTPPSESTPSSSINSSGEINQPNNQNSSSSSSSRYSSQITLNITNNNLTDNNTANKFNSHLAQQKNLELEINQLRQKLKDTEVSLKKEQTEKYLIEYKLKQQQQDNDQQMRNIINRLIKVEEELRKEQSEMHKLLKAKQDLIEIQKKRIEYLSNRSLSGNPTVHKSTQYNPSLAHNNTTSNYNQHVYQPKLRQLNKTQIKAQASSNPSLSETIPVPVQSNQLPSTKSSAEKSQIAASPSSSSSSMTQFCSYLATNPSKTTQSGSKLNKLKNSTLIGDQQGNSSSSIVSTSSNLINQTQLNGQGSNNFLRASEL